MENGRVGDHYKKKSRDFVSSSSRRQRECNTCYTSQRTILTVPSHELEMKLSLVTGFQAVAKASRLCSWKIMTGNSLEPMSKSLSDPSPQATTSWFSLISDQAKSYIASFVSNLYIYIYIRRRVSLRKSSSFVRSCHGKLIYIKTHVFSTWMPCDVSARAKSRPFPTMPKLAAAPTAMRESWYGEYLTA